MRKTTNLYEKPVRGISHRYRLAKGVQFPEEFLVPVAPRKLE